MIIQAAMLFAFLTSVAEFIILAKIPPRRRLRILGSAMWCNALHVAFLGANLFIHWGTLIGTMSAITASIMSIFVVMLCRWWFGYIKDNRWYYAGRANYSPEVLL